MQTFMPYIDTVKTARSLDRQRLGKQRVECKQIILTLDRVASGESKGTGWANHPAVRMWAGHEATLAMYAMHICQEWVRRGYRDTMLPWFGDVIERHGDHTLVDPVWWGREDVHASHRAMLLRKDRAHYQVAFGLSDREVQVTLDQQSEYVWPV